MDSSSDEKQSEKKSENISVNCLRYTAFLYAEYVLRNIERTNPELVEFLKCLKEVIKEYAIKYKEYAREQAKIYNKEFDENVCVDANIILDSVLELECYHHSTDYDCELFCGACLNKYSLRPECENETFMETVENIQKSIKPENDNDDFYKNFKKIVELSLSEGVYITHLDSFRQKEYYYKDVPENLPASYFFQDIFFKSNKAFWGDSKLIDYKAPSSSPYENEDQVEKAWERMESIKLTTKEEHRFEYLLENNFTIFIPVYNKNINLENILDQVNSVVIAFQLNSIERGLGDYQNINILLIVF